MWHLLTIQGARRRVRAPRARSSSSSRCVEGLLWEGTGSAPPKPRCTEDCRKCVSAARQTRARLEPAPARLALLSVRGGGCCWIAILQYFSMLYRVARLPVRLAVLLLVAVVQPTHGMVSGYHVDIETCSGLVYNNKTAQLPIWRSEIPVCNCVG